jgi:hypothetical protein
MAHRSNGNKAKRKALNGVTFPFPLRERARLWSIREYSLTDDDFIQSQIFAT